jgi:hemerythrin superfamily protein
MKLKDLIPKSILPETKEDAIAFLRADHDKVEDLFVSFDEIKYGRADAEEKRLVTDLCREFQVHAALEEEIFYPAVRAEIADDDLMNEARVEHEGAKRLVAELEAMDPDDEMLNAKMHVLCAYIKLHVREEEEDIFRKARESSLDLVALAGRMRKRKRQLLGSTAPKGRRAAVARKPRSSAAETRAGR